MITYFFALIASWILNFVSWIFNALLGWLFPPGVAGAIQWMFTPLQYFGWFIDLHFLGEMLFYLMSFLVIWWTYKILRFGFSAVVALVHGGATLEHPDLH